MREIKEKYFTDSGFKENTFDVNELKMVEVIIGLSIVQNGPIPKFFKEEFLQQIFNSEPTNDPRESNPDSFIVELGSERSCFQSIREHHVLST